MISGKEKMTTIFNADDADDTIWSAWMEVIDSDDVVNGSRFLTEDDPTQTHKNRWTLRMKFL